MISKSQAIIEDVGNRIRSGKTATRVLCGVKWNKRLTKEYLQASRKALTYMGVKRGE